MARRIAIALLRNDLRTSDNPVLYAARDAPGVTHLLPLFVFDERQIELAGIKGFPESHAGSLPEARTRICGFWRTGRHRACFLAQSVFDVKTRLKGLGSDLGIYCGRAEHIVPSLVRHLESKGDKVDGVWLQREAASEEQTVERRLATALEGTKTPFHLDASARTLVHESDLPFKMPGQLPDVFTAFRKRVEGLNDRMTRPVLEDPSKAKWPAFPDIASEDIPKGVFALPKNVDQSQLIEQLLKPLVERPALGDLDPSSVFYQHTNTAFPMQGGETAARKRLDHYMGKSTSATDCPAVTYKDTRNGMLGADYSTKFSPFLTFGCLSAREIAARCDELEDRLREANKLDEAARKNVYWIKFELLWRDYMFFVNLKYGSDIFKLQGLLGSVAPGDAKERSDWKSWDERDDKLQAWFEGRTGVPFVDACMRELVLTGYMSNRGRQNVASFITKDLYFDWRIGAEFFETFLLDYDPSSNYGNWAYVAGVGNDPRENRKFNVIKQAKDYDPEGDYVVRWISEITGPELNGFQRHVPWRVWAGSDPSQAVGTYPHTPVLEDSSWRKFYPGGGDGGHERRGGGRGGRGGRGRGGGRGGRRERGSRAKGGSAPSEE